MENKNIILKSVKDDDLLQFLNEMQSSLEIIKHNDGMNFDLEWITKIKDAAQYIDNIFANPKSFIVNEEEILNIEKTKKVTIDSVKHLAKHSNFIEEYDREKDYIKPSKLLNVLKEETYNTYENRFIYTLVDFLDSFVYKMEQKLKDLDLKSNNQFNYNGKTSINNEFVTYNFTMKSNKRISFRDDSVDFKNDIKTIKGYISSWKASSVYMALEKERVPKVVNPIKKTNVILKNPNFKIASKLWDYIYNYSESIDNLDKLPKRFTDLPLKYEKHIKNSFAMTYFIMKYMNSNSEIQKNDFENKIKSLNMLMLDDITSSIIETNNEITKEQLISVVSDKYDEVKMNNGFDYNTIENKIKTNIKEYIDQVNDSYFEIGGIEFDKKDNEDIL